MESDFHVFLSDGGSHVVIEVGGATLKFPSLFEAIRYLRSLGNGFVVIHDDENQSTNRIPLALIS